MPLLACRCDDDPKRQKAGGHTFRRWRGCGAANKRCSFAIAAPEVATPLNVRAGGAAGGRGTRDYSGTHGGPCAAAAQRGAAACPGHVARRRRRDSSRRRSRTSSTRMRRGCSSRCRSSRAHLSIIIIHNAVGGLRTRRIKLPHFQVWPLLTDLVKRILRHGHCARPRYLWVV